MNSITAKLKTWLMMATLAMASNYAQAQSTQKIEPEILKAVETAFADKNFDKLKQLAEQEIQGSPDSYTAWYWKGLAELNLDQLKESVASNSRVVQLNSKLHSGWHNLGVGYLGLFDDAQAIDAFQQAVRLNSNFTLGWEFLSRSYVLFGDGEKAYDAYLQLRGLDDSKAIQILESFGLPKVATKDDFVANTLSIDLGLNSEDTVYAASRDAYTSKDFKKLEKIAKTVLVRNPNSWQGWHWRGLSQLESGSTEQCSASYAIVKKLNPNFGIGWSNSGLCTLALDRTNEALAEFKRAVELDPTIAIAWRNMWHIYQEQGNRDKAYEAYARLNALDREMAQESAMTYGVPTDPAQDMVASSPKAAQTSTLDDRLKLTEIKVAINQIDQAELLILDDEANRALLLLEDAYKKLAMHLGSDSSEAARANDDLLLAYAEVRDFSESFRRITKGSLINADSFWHRVLKNRQEKFGEKNEKTVRAKALLGFILTAQGNLGKAKTLLATAYSDSVEISGSEDYQTLTIAVLKVFLDSRIDAAQTVIDCKAIAAIFLKQGKLNDPVYLATERCQTVEFISNKNYQAGIKHALNVFNMYKTVYGEEHFATLNVMGDLALIYRLGGRPLEALNIAERAYELSETAHGVGASQTYQSLGVLGVIYSLVNRNDDAITALKKAIELNDKYSSQGDLTGIPLQVFLATTYTKQRKNTDALLLLESLVPKIEKMRQTDEFSVEDKQAFFARNITIYRMYASHLSLIDQDKSFHVAELSKARTLIESTAMQIAQTSGVLTASETQQLEEYDRQLTSVNARLSLLRSSDPLTVKLLSDKLELIRSRVKFKEMLKQSNTKFANLSDVKIVDAAEGKALLLPDEVFVSYLTIGRSLLIYALDRSGLLVKQIDVGDDFNLKLVKYRELIESQPKPSASNTTSNVAPQTTANKQQIPGTLPYFEESIGKTLFGPIASKLKDKKRIIISPDETLALIPFESLMLDNKLLIERFDISYVQSMSLMSLLKTRKTEYKSFNSRKDIFAMGGASYSALPRWAQSWVGRGNNLQEENAERASAQLISSKDHAGHVRAIDSLKAQWSDLPGSAQEVTAVGKLFGNQQSMILTKSEASEQNLQRLNVSGDLRNYKRLLFATHGYVNPIQPGLSAIVLSQNNKTETADGYVTAIEWPSYNLKSDLIVFSACNTATGKVVSGEGVLGLPFSLFVAGNTNTIMTLWTIDDKSTSQFIESFFKKIKNGETEVAALSQTKREFLKDNRYSHPAFWAPFVMYGY